MITAVIVLSVIALALGGYIAFDIFRDNRSINDVNMTAAADSQQTADNVAAPTAEQKRAVEQPAPPAALSVAEDDAPQAEEPDASATEQPQSTEDEPEQVIETPVNVEPQANEKAAPTVEDAPKESEATDKPQAEKKTRRSRYKDPEIVFTEEVEKGRSKIEQKPKPQTEPQTAEPEANKKPRQTTAKKTVKKAAEKKPEQKVEPQTPAVSEEKIGQNKPAADKKPTEPIVEEKAEPNVEPQVAEPQAVEPDAVEPDVVKPQAAEPQVHAEEDKNKIAQNISVENETVAEIQMGDKAAEIKSAVENKMLPPDEVRTEVAATEVDKIMTDEVAESFIERSEGKTDKTKQGIINIDTLSACFDSGEVVTLDEIKKRVKGFNKKTTYIKVLARGTLGKSLIVEADNFSLQAVKMIVLTGGKAIKKQ